MEATFKHSNGLTLTFKDSDVLNMGDWDYASNAYIIHGEFGTLCVVLANDESDALDIAADHKSNPLKCYRVPDESFQALNEEADGKNGHHAQARLDEFEYIGNYGAPFDFTYVRIYEIPKPKMSLVTLWNAEHGTDNSNGS